MEHSEFTPPPRLSLTDQEISARLGAATADEAGMIAAMDFLEEQTNLRNQDNLAIESWISKMSASSDPRAKIALENLERAKKGLDPLPLVQPVPEFPSFNPSPELIAETVVPATVEEVSTVEVEPVLEQPVFSTEPNSEPVGSAEELAEAFEEELEVSTPKEIEQQLDVFVPKVRGGRLVSAANWIIGLGILAPAIGAAFASLSGLNFVTSVLAGIVGVLVGVKVNVISLFTARRTERGLAVASRAAFGVFGAILPGLTLILAGISAVAALAFGSAKYFNNTIVGLADFGGSVLSLGSIDVTGGSIFAMVLVVVAATLAVFGGAFSRWVRITIGGLLLASFLAYAILTISSIDYLNLAGVFQPAGFLFVAPIFALVVSVFAYGIDGESLAASSWGAKPKTLTWPVAIFGFLLPLLTFGHFAALLNGHDFKDGLEVVQFVLASGDLISSTILVDFGLLAVVGLLYLGISKMIDALKTLGINHIGYGLASLVSVFVTLSIVALALVPDSLGLAIDLTSLFLIPAGAWVGVQLTEALMRRGKYHDASLTLGYGFYGSVNWIAGAGFVIAVTFAFSVAQRLDSIPWFGFLTPKVGWYVTPAVAALLAMAIEVIYTLATGFPNVLRQQRETKSVEDRRFDLVDVVVE